MRMVFEVVETHRVNEGFFRLHPLDLSRNRGVYVPRGNRAAY